MAKASTQDFLEIDQIREGVIVLKSKALRGILMISSLNFALKSVEEQETIIYQFQNLLNSLDFSIQIVIQSRKMNITGYLDQIETLRDKQTGELMKMQTTSYYDFIKGLIEGDSIMSKTFFLVVPYTVSEDRGVRGSESVLNMPKIPSLTEEQFQRCKSQLWQRMEFLALGLKRMELQAVPLSTPELIEFFWSIHHPKEAEIGYYPEIPPELMQDENKTRF
ncbi:MAG: hypothetical protein COX42_00385 [Parcubacteria group bacterium CG23_combo_of_CG06-09_8_20_14_all_35_6]|nr:MAG: hypothetical protein COX42_00385 [Parcubacteria group bacterium CG23_combo_of_CG06-09_8_20_14_all_35_6]